MVPLDDASLAAWRERVAAGRAALGWPIDQHCLARRHARGVTLVFAAPLDQLFTATELNEWALCAAFAAREPAHWRAMLAAQRALPIDDAEAAAALEPSIVELYLEHPDLADAEALAWLRDHAAREAQPALRRLVDVATSRGLQCVVDDDLITLGAGSGARSYRRSELPPVAVVPWEQLASVPTVLVTGSNGKTTTVRLVAAILRANGAMVGYSSTDGVFIGGVEQVGGDYSGPAGARAVLRHPEVEAAVLETARGGILRRGLAVEAAEVALVTNVSADHFGEYGVDDLADLVAVKLTVARALRPGGALVLNADDPLLAVAEPPVAARRAWFALDADHPVLAAARTVGGTTCGLRRGHLMLGQAGVEHDLGTATTMPIAFGGHATHNVANLAAAAVVATELGIGADVIRIALQRFGADPADNLGRLMHFERDGVQVLLDYAHNVDGFARLQPVVEALRTRSGRRGRLALLLGHAGNRMDEDIAAVVAAALDLGPDLVVVKEISGKERGRAPGEVAELVRRTLQGLGVTGDAVAVELDEVVASHRALAWARSGDVVLLLVHGAEARTAVLESLQR